MEELGIVRSVGVSEGFSVRCAPEREIALPLFDL